MDEHRLANEFRGESLWLVFIVDPLHLRASLSDG